MAKLNASVRNAMYNVSSFRGLNESENGAQLKDGEASVIKNFRVTDDGTLTPRASITVIDTVQPNPAAETSAVTQMMTCDIGGIEYVYVLVGGRLCRLHQAGNGAWTEESISSEALPKDSSMFAFGENLYVLTGSDFYRVDGDVLTKVEGYIPTIMVGANSAGTGTLVERVNLLNTQRRVRYSGDGETKSYSVPEDGDIEVSQVAVDGEILAATEFSINQSNVYGKRASIVFKTAPSAGTDNVEVIYALSSKQYFRSDIYQTARGSFNFAPTGTVINAVLLVRGLDKETATHWSILQETTDYTVSGTTITLVNPSEWGVVFITYEIGNLRNQVTKMRYAERYNGVQDNRVFLYGDGSNKCVYSGICEDGTPSAEYFPDLNECRFGDTTSPLNAMVKHRNRLLAFKTGETYSVYSDIITLADGSSTTGFYISSINKQIGSCAVAQAETVENRVRTVDGADIWEWRSTTTSGNITSDARNAERISQRVFKSLAGFDLTACKLFYDKARHEFYCFDGSKALVQNVEADAWYAYDEFPLTTLCRYNGKLIGGSDDGDIVELDETATPDFTCRWISGAIDYGKPYKLKYSPELWISLLPQNSKALTVKITSDKGDAASTTIRTPNTGIVKPAHRARLKLRKITTSTIDISATTRLTITGINVSVSFNNNVK